MKNFLVFLIALFYLTQMYAQTAVAPAVGNGTSINPYQIETWQNLYWISQNTDQQDKHYVQTADITFPGDINTWDGGKGWTPIGIKNQWPPRFSGTYNGQNKKITGLFINNPYESYMGLFGFVSEYGKISNLSIENLYVAGEENVGGLVGQNEGEIINCFTQGEIIGFSYCGGLIGKEWGKILQSGSSCSVTGMDNVGGLVGENRQVLYDYSVSGMDSGDSPADSKSFTKGIYQCYATGDVSGNWTIGGFVGYNDGIIKKSFATGNVYPNEAPPNNVGGFVGQNYWYIEDSWCKGEVNGSGYVGGFVGVNGEAEEWYVDLEQCEIRNSYSLGEVYGDFNVGAFAGWNYYYEDEEFISEALIWTSFYNSETADWLPEIGGGLGAYDISGVSTADMQSRATFINADWDFQCETTNGEEYIWGINSNDNNQYPFLSWQGFISEGCPQWTGAIGTDWDEPGNWLNNLVPPLGSSVYVPDGLSNYPAINQNQTVIDLSIEVGTSLTISPSVNLDVEGTFNNQAGASGFVIGSNQSGTASLIHNSAGLEGTMQRYIPGYESKGAGGWHLLASPVENFEIAGSDFEPGTNDDLYVWDEVNYQWLNYKDAVNNITHFISGKGYLVAYQNDACWNFEGHFPYEDVTHTDLCKTTDMGDGWHLLGNPFQSSLKWNDGNWSLTNIATGAKILNSGGTYTDITVDGANEYIPASQGFFIQATVDADNSITIPAAARNHDATSFYKSEKQNLLTLRAADDQFYVETWIQVMDGATPGYDENYDVKFFGGMYNAPYFYSTISEGVCLSTNRIGDIVEETEIPLGFKSFLNHEITITASNPESFGSITEIYLVDKKENIRINLKEMPEYAFMATANEITERFSIIFMKSTGIYEGGDAEQIYFYTIGNELYLNTVKPQKALLSVYNISGQQVYTNKLMLDGSKKINLNLSPGWYVVSVISDKNAISRKFFLN